MRSILATLFGFISLSTAATTYLPIPFETQLKAADAVVDAVYQGKIYKKVSSGDVVTELSFKVVSSVGIESNRLQMGSDLKVIMPGGVWQGIVYHIHGLPEFMLDEEAVLLLRMGEFGYQIENLGLGKYRIIEEDGKRFISSVIFPDHDQLGKIQWSEFLDLVRANFDSEMVGVPSDTKIIVKNSNEKTERLPASLSQEQAAVEKPLNIFWLVLILSFMGAGSIYLIKSRSEEDI